MDPITCDPQLLSPLFRLPRELRAQIYEHHVFKEHGYIHDFVSGHMLRRIDGADVKFQPVRLGLMLTCKMAAEELQGVAFSVNTLTFRTGLPKNGSEKYREVSSITGRSNICSN